MEKDYLPKNLEDEYYTEHHSIKKIGAGGQGFVLKTENPLVVIKISTDNNGSPITEKNNTNEFKRQKKRFENLRILPLPEGIHISAPVAVLNDYAGYVMQFMEDMMPLSNLDILKIENYPEWLVGKNPLAEISEAQKLLASYCESGGLRKRLFILGQAASVLAELHSAGLVYCDVSNNNIFVTNDVDFETPNVWLIDADNIFISSADTKRGNFVYTPRYVAPEVFLGQSACTQASDIYAFAICAFEKLTLVYPFSGAETENWDDDDDWDKSTNNTATSDPDVKINSGAADWIWAEEGTNSTTNGLPPQLTLTDTLFKLFEKTFQKGRKNPAIRPTALLWRKAFFEACDLTLQCPDCKMSWYYDGENNICPYCENKIKKIITIKENNKTIFAHELIPNKQINIVHERLAFANFDNSRKIFLSLSLDKNQMLNLELNNFNEYKVLIDQKNNKKSISIRTIMPCENFFLTIEYENRCRVFNIIFNKEEL
ncbi:MAG: protein kinase [Treponemataceae bacterium]